MDAPVEGVIATPQRPSPLLSDEDRHRLLVEWNRTEVDFPRDRCLHELIAEQAQRTPAAVVSDGRSQLTFLELNETASHLASRLRQLGAGPDELVGICMQRSTDLVVGLLGILRTGAAFMPLEPDQPGQRLALMLAEARPKVVLTTAQDRHLLPAIDAHILCVDSDRDSWMSCPPVAANDCRADSLAYVLFTSGSTGAPKGVMVEHRSLVNQLLWKCESFGLTAADHLLQRTPLGFDPALSELFCPLLSGASLTLLPPGDHADPQRLAEAVRDHRITVLGLVPSMLEEFVAAADPGERSGLRLVTCGGEVISPAMVRAFFDRFGPRVELRNMYGPTEAVLAASWWRCDPSSDGPVPIGRPVANTQIYVLDGRLEPVPIGTPGELCIGGVQVARGYLNQPQLTAQQFVANPFRQGERIYRTGDLARYRSDGAIEFLGRRDGQIKLRGIRIELGEIEAVLSAHPGVARAVVVARDDEARRQRLVAYIVPAGENSPRLGELRASLGSRLPDHMMPTALMILDALPLTPSGKVDRTALPDPDWRPVATFRAPRSPLEQRMAALWARTLRVQTVGIDDDFFELGGHSLLAVRLLVKVEREFGVTLPLGAFFEGSATVARLVSAIESPTRGPDERAGSARVQSSGDTPVLFFIQPGESAMLTLRHFMRALGPQQRVMGLLPDRKGARFDQSRSIEDLAAGILSTIRETQAIGPYYLAGFSMGGLLAYEIANQLRAGGEEVAWLALLDASSPAHNRKAMRRRLSLAQRLTRQRERGLRGSAQKTVEVVNREVTAALVRLHLRRSRLGDDFDWRGALRLGSRYVCQGNDVPMDLFAAAEGVVETGSPSLGWEKVHKGPLHVHDVPGGHVSMMTAPHVSVVAKMLTLSLQRAQAAGEA